MSSDTISAGRSKVLCKYFLNGVCKFGDACLFSHDRSDLPSQVCTYYLAGCCAFGDKCRYEHVKPNWHSASQPSVASSAAPALVEKPVMDNNAAIELVPNSTSCSNAWMTPEERYGTDETWYPYSYPGYDCTGYDASFYDADSNGWDESQCSSYELVGNIEHDSGEASTDSQSPEEIAWEHEGQWEEGGTAHVTDPADAPLCSHYSHNGWCPWGEQCSHIHGDVCETCQKYCLHIYNQQDAEKHTKDCTARHARIQARLRSSAVECCICFERVLNKEQYGERRFGLLDCEHSFCLSCIRSWRSNTEVDVEQASRTCPVCRITTHFVTPSSVWPASAEEKAAIVNGYKTKLRRTDCRHFNFGEGTCPFGGSCFYRHAYKDGKLQEHVLRKAGNADGEVKVLQPLRLSSFFDTPQARRLLTRR